MLVRLSPHSNAIIAPKQSSRQPTDYKKAHQTYKHSLDYGSSSLTSSAVSLCPWPSALPLRHPMHKIRLLGFGAAIPRKGICHRPPDGRSIGCRATLREIVFVDDGVGVEMSLLLFWHQKCCYKLHEAVKAYSVRILCYWPILRDRDDRSNRATEKVSRLRIIKIQVASTRHVNEFRHISSRHC